MKRTVEAMDRFNLDFDDAYQYVSATSEDLNLVSLDDDFDDTDLDRWTPLDVIDQEQA